MKQVFSLLYLAFLAGACEWKEPSKMCRVDSRYLHIEGATNCKAIEKNEKPFISCDDLIIEAEEGDSFQCK